MLMIVFVLVITIFLLFCMELFDSIEGMRMQ